MVYIMVCLLVVKIKNFMFRDNLGESRRGWKFGLTPPPSLRSKAYQVIWEVLPNIRARLAFKLGHAKFPIVT